MQEFLNQNILKVGKVDVQVVDLVVLISIFLVTRLLLWLIKRIIIRGARSRRIDERRSHGVYQIIKYMMVVIAIILALDVIGIKITILLAGSAALLVGVGLGIQQLFNDLVSGIVLLVEGSVSVEDIVEIDGVVGKVEEINLRTSQLLTRDGISILVPNSKLVGDNVINWSHNSQITRFKIGVGVAYGSNVQLVMDLIKKAVTDHPKAVSQPAPNVRLVDFGESSLDFEVYFWSEEMWFIEDVRSQIRIEIERLFGENHVTIPFPQRDLHLKEMPQAGF